MNSWVESGKGEEDIEEISSSPARSPILTRFHIFINNFFTFGGFLSFFPISMLHRRVDEWKESSIWIEQNHWRMVPAELSMLYIFIYIYSTLYKCCICVHFSDIPYAIILSMCAFFCLSCCFYIFFLHCFERLSVSCSIHTFYSNRAKTSIDSTG